MVSSKLLRMFVDDAWDDPSALLLREQLRAYETAARQILAGGTFSSTSANGRHVALTGSGPGHATQLEVAEAWRYLIDTYDRSVQELGIVVAEDGGNEILVKAQMMINLREVMGYTNNFMYLSK